MDFICGDGNIWFEGRILRFHEYRSMNADGKLIPLSTRSLTACAPGAGSEECVISEQEVETYTKRNALGGSEGFEPDKLCAQINAQSGKIAGEKAAENQIVWKDDIELEDNLLKWNKQEETLCYFLFKKEADKWIYLENTISNQINLNEYGAGSYCVRAANQRGGLGGATKTIDLQPARSNSRSIRCPPRHLHHPPKRQVLQKIKFKDTPEKSKKRGWQEKFLPAFNF